MQTGPLVLPPASAEPLYCACYRVDGRREISPTSDTQTFAGQSGLRVVAMGGGTGLSTLLRGLRKYVVPRTAHRLSSTTAWARSPA